MGPRSARPPSPTPSRMPSSPGWRTSRRRPRRRPVRARSSGARSALVSWPGSWTCRPAPWTSRSRSSSTISCSKHPASAACTTSAISSCATSSTGRSRPPSGVDSMPGPASSAPSWRERRRSTPRSTTSGPACAARRSRPRSWAPARPRRMSAHRESFELYARAVANMPDDLRRRRPWSTLRRLCPRGDDDRGLRDRRTPVGPGEGCLRGSRHADQGCRDADRGPLYLAARGPFVRQTPGARRGARRRIRTAARGGSSDEMRAPSAAVRVGADPPRIARSRCRPRHDPRHAPVDGDHRNDGGT